MRRVLAIIAVGLLATGCTTASNGSGSSASTTVAAAPTAYAPFVGDWSGRLASGKSVRVQVSESGTTRYYYQGRSTSVNGVQVSGNTMSFKVGRGFGTVTLTTTGGSTLGYSYTEGGESYPATLTKS
ncbi:hypothetical protein [Antarcticirhabdus aurantiaca]|uniref:Uncharacterized protein n=1 Tax=Antarcticirhabdus aurantiaca TaxID=2606717 RepID=A0ACD4NV12_9HYPH|nr:hypothetical protein [Antarcticirhabdus aurantiaca]WAJ30624.1 hypothetical protein OXU80_10630 [Jeongeuplla avenae]